MLVLFDHDFLVAVSVTATDQQLHVATYLFGVVAMHLDVLVLLDFLLLAAAFVAVIHLIFAVPTAATPASVTVAPKSRACSSMVRAGDS